MVKLWHTRIYRMPFVVADVGPSTRPILQQHKGIPALRPARHTKHNGGSGLSHQAGCRNRGLTTGWVSLVGSQQEVQGRSIGPKDKPLDGLKQLRSNLGPVVGLRRRAPRLSKLSPERFVLS